MRNRLIALIIITTTTLALSGCWNRRDPENLALVLAMAFDMEPGTGLHRVIAQIANPLAMGGQDAGQGSGGEKKTFWTLSASGQLLHQAMRNLTEGVSREFFWAHNRIFILSEEVARKGIYPIMDMVERERQLRTSAHVVIVDGDVKKLMEAEFPLEETGAKGFDRQIATIRYERSLFPVKTMNDLYSTLPQPGKEMFIGRVKVSEGLQQDQSSQSPGTAALPPAIIGGGALFKGDRMVGWAGEQETLGWAIATGRVFRAMLNVKDPIDENISLGIDIASIHSSMKPIIKDGRLGIMVDIVAAGHLHDVPVYRDLKLQSDYIKSVEQKSAQAIRDAVQSTIDLSRSMESDIIGFGNLIYRKKPKLWNEIESRWYQILNDIEIDVRVEMNIKQTGLLTSPLETEKRR
jgi:spore germination protein KC